MAHGVTAVSSPIIRNAEAGVPEILPSTPKKMDLEEPSSTETEPQVGISEDEQEESVNIFCPGDYEQGVSNLTAPTLAHDDDSSTVVGSTVEENRRYSARLRSRTNSPSN
jgi:hypothetical protein